MITWLLNQFILPTISKIGRKLFSVVVFFLSFLFCSQNWVPQIIIGLRGLIYQSKSFSVVIRTTLQPFKKPFSVQKKTSLKFLIFGLNLSE